VQFLKRIFVFLIELIKKLIKLEQLAEVIFDFVALLLILEDNFYDYIRLPPYDLFSQNTHSVFNNTVYALVGIPFSAIQMS